MNNNKQKRQLQRSGFYSPSAAIASHSLKAIYEYSECDDVVFIEYLIRQVDINTLWNKSQYHI